MINPVVFGRSSKYSAGIRRRRLLLRGLAALAVLALLAGAVFKGPPLLRGFMPVKSELARLWKSGDYDSLFRRTGELLAHKPLDYRFLTLRGFAAYQLAAAQISHARALTFIDDCVFALRRARVASRGRKDARVSYVLGKAYYYKGREYAVLAVKYLEEAQAASYKAQDIPEYLGLAYAAINDYHSSVAAFAGALPSDGSDPSDALLLAIANSYLALGETEQARAYLVRCMEVSKDGKAVNAARLLWGGVLARSGDREEARALFQAVLDEEPGNAGALFQMGELLAAEGNYVAARARWRDALRNDPFHKEARARLGL